MCKIHFLQILLLFSSYSHDTPWKPEAASRQLGKQLEFLHRKTAKKLLNLAYGVNFHPNIVLSGDSSTAIHILSDNFVKNFFNFKVNGFYVQGTTSLSFFRFYFYLSPCWETTYITQLLSRRMHRGKGYACTWSTACHPDRHRLRCL